MCNRILEGGKGKPLVEIPAQKQRIIARPAVGRGDEGSVPELLEEAKSQRELAAKMREQLGPPTEEEKRESRIRSVYASLAIEDPDVTIEEVREALESSNGSV